MSIGGSQMTYQKSHPHDVMEITLIII